MNFERVAELVAELTLLRFFPGDESARLAIVRMVGQMAENEDQVRWLVRRTLDLWNEWPGPLEFRAVFCSRFKPKDGKNAYSERFTDGLPPAVVPDCVRIAENLKQLWIEQGATYDPGWWNREYAAAMRDSEEKRKREEQEKRMLKPRPSEDEFALGAD
jgi:hypothetical protein